MSRRTRWILYAFLAVLLLVAVAYSYFFHLGGMERAINSQISALLGDDSPVLIRVGRVKGNLLSGVVVNDISVVYCDSITAFHMISIPRLTAGYSLSNLWNKRFLFDFLYVDSAHVVVVRDSTGRTIVPMIGGGSVDEGEAIQFAIDDLHLNKCGLDIVSPEDTVEVRDLVVSCSVRSEEGQHSVLIKQISFDSNLEDLRLSAASGGLTVSGPEILFRILPSCPKRPG